MELQKQINTIEQGKKFASFGLTTKSYFAWYKVNNNAWIPEIRKTLPAKSEILPAYSCAELLYFIDQIQKIANKKDRAVWSAGIISKMQTPEMRKLLRTHYNAELVLNALKYEIIYPKELKL